MDGNKRYFITKYITGGCWVITGIVGNFNNIVTDIIRIAFLVLLVGVLIYQTGQTEAGNILHHESKRFCNHCHVLCVLHGSSSDIHYFFLVRCKRLGVAVLHNAHPFYNTRNW